MAERADTTEAVKQIAAVVTCTPGACVPWEALEEILAPLTRRDRRFRTIYRAWIRYCRKWHNRKVIVQPGRGLRILREGERAEEVCSTLGKTWRLFDRAKTDVDDIQIAELSSPEVEQAHHVRHTTHRLHHAMAQERAALIALFPKPEASPQTHGLASLAS